MARVPQLSFFGAGLGWGLVYLFLFLYRCLVSVLGETFVLRLTSIADTGTYQSGVVSEVYQAAAQGISDDFIGALVDVHGGGFTTIVTIKIGAIFNELFFGNPYLINIGFQTFTFIGLIYLLHSTAPALRLRLLVLTMLPSFTLWTSIASKESIVAASVAVLTAYLIRMYDGKVIPGLHHVVAAIVLFVFKPYYGVAFAYGITTTFVSQFIRRKALVSLLMGIFTLVGLYTFHEQFVRYSLVVQDAFIIATPTHVGGWGSRTTRTEPFFVEDIDVFIKAPEGIIRAFFGPTIPEVSTSVLHLITFLEGVVLAIALAFIVLKSIRRLPVYNAILGIFMAFWILLPSYPFGVMNPGTAIRYRSGYILLIIVVFAVLMSRPLYLNWVERTTRRSTSTQHVFMSSTRI